MGVQAQRCSKPEEVEEKLKWLIESEGPALLEVFTDKKVPVLPMVPAGSALHEFLVYDEGKCSARIKPPHIYTDTLRVAKNKERKALMKKRGVTQMLN